MIFLCVLVNSSIEEHIAKSSCDPSAYEDSLDELKNFKSVDLNFLKERKVLAQSFLCPTKGSYVHSTCWYCLNNYSLIN